MAWSSVPGLVEITEKRTEAVHNCRMGQQPDHYHSAFNSVFGKSDISPSFYDVSIVFSHLVFTLDLSRLILRSISLVVLSLSSPYPPPFYPFTSRFFIQIQNQQIAIHYTKIFRTSKLNQNLVMGMKSDMISKDRTPVDRQLGCVVQIA